MDIIPFDAVAYMQTLHSRLKLTKYKYKFCVVSGISVLEDILTNARHERCFFAVDDSQDGTTFRGAGAGYFERRPYTIFIIQKADYGKMDQRKQIIAEADAIYRALLSRMIKDKLNIPVLKMEQIRFYEVPAAFATGTAGLYFTFTVEVPVNLIYNADEWDIQ